MALERAVLRQLKDIQLQADQLLQPGAELDHIKDFVQYATENKHYLLDNLDEPFITKHVHEVPEINVDQMEVKAGLLVAVVGILFSGLATLIINQRKKRLLETYIREIKGKYGSVEFLLKNYFD